MNKSLNSTDYAYIHALILNEKMYAPNKNIKYLRELDSKVLSMYHRQSEIEAEDAEDKRYHKHITN